MAILFKKADANEYNKCGLYHLASKHWQVPSVWQTPSFSTLGLGSYNSQLYASEIRYKDLTGSSSKISREPKKGLNL